MDWFIWAITTPIPIDPFLQLTMVTIAGSLIGIALKWFWKR